MVPLIIKGFLPQQNGSSIMVAEDVTTLSGCDFDVDKMFLMLYNFIFDEYGKPRKLKPRKPAIGQYKNDADAIAVSKMSKEERDNLIIDLSTAILTHPDMAWVSSKPGSYDNLKRASRVAQILENKEMLEQFKTQYGVTTGLEIKNKFKELPLLEDIVDKDGNVTVQCLENFVNEHKEVINPLELTTFKYFHRQNMTGGALVGIYANNTTMQAKYQETKLWLKESDKIMINDAKYTNLTRIYSEDGSLISFNCSETSAASVDNGKDPVLADLMQNKKTAKVLGMLLRAGIPIEDATMVFNLPNVREVIIHTGALDKLATRASSLKTMMKEVFFTTLDTAVGKYDESVRTNNIDSGEVINFIQEYREKSPIVYGILYGEKFNKNGVPDYKGMREALKQLFPEDEGLNNVKAFVQKDLDYSIIVNHYNTVADDLRDITSVSRADSPNGAIAHTLQDAVLQKRAVDMLHMKYKKSTIQGIHNIINNDVVNINESSEEMLSKFLEHGTPRLQAFFSLGIDLPLTMVSKYFVQTNPWMTEKTKELFEQSYNGTLDARLLKYFYNGMMHYCLSKTRLFGTDANMTFEEKRDWYLYEFPKKFINLRNKYTKLNNHAIIGRMEVRAGIIEMLRAGRLTETQRLVLSNSITSLILGDEVEQDLAKDLLIYAYHSTGLNFGPNNYGMFFNTTFYNQFPEFVNALRMMQYSVNEESGLMKNFMDQFYAMYGTMFTNKRSVKISDFDYLVSIKTNTVLNKNVYNARGVDEPLKYITLEYEVPSETGKEIKRALFKKVKTEEDGVNTVYERIGSIYDPFTGHIRYNANRTALELSKDVNSEETLKKAEEQRKISYKLGAEYEYKGRVRDDKNAMLNAFADVNVDALDQADIPDVPPHQITDFSKLEGTAADLDRVSLDSSIDDYFSQDFSDDDLGIHMQEDYGDFLDRLPEGLDSAFDKLESSMNVINSLDNLDLDSLTALDDYGIDEGNAQLIESMC